MKQQPRIAVREAATLLDEAAIEEVAGGHSAKIQAGLGTTYSNTQACGMDTTTDCWVTGGNLVSNDDAQAN